MIKLITIIAGDRNFTDYEFIKKHLLAIQTEDWGFSKIISGNAKGVDKLGEKFADEFNIQKIIVEAQWKFYGRRAGIIRNKRMAEISQALIAFPAPESKGTKNMIYEAQGRGLFVRIINLP